MSLNDTYHTHAHTHNYGEGDRIRLEERRGTTEPLSVVQDNVGPYEGTSAHPLCVCMCEREQERERGRERLKWRVSGLNCIPLSLVFNR